ncbi:CC-NBS-LRR resistance protein, partial [Trifolium medium]|nr:CC-NBS-LRR resistance protein [Trifolium medium]
AIAVIASSLKDQQLRKHEWDATLKSLKKPVSMHGVDDDMVGIYKCLKFSYDYMKDETAKGLFLLSSVFPEDKEIPIEILTRLGIGTGLFGEDYGSYDDARTQAVVAKNKLIDSCLLVEVGEAHVKMHDLVRDAAQWIANKEIRGKEMDLFSCKYDGSKLETLIVDVDRDEHRKCGDAYFFSKATLKYCMQTTEALQLYGIKEGWRNLMPEIVPVDLGMNDLVELSLGCISQLQCLIDTIGSQVPKVLSKLVVLELDRSENLEEMFNGSLSFDSLKNLEELSIQVCKKLQSLFNCKLNLCNLKTVKLWKCPMLVSLFPLLTALGT